MYAMKITAVLVVLAAVALPATAMTALETDMALDFKERPVMKVVRLLQDTKSELQKELDDDREVYEAMTCWCKTNGKDKTTAIALSNGQIAALESSMGEASGKVEELKQKRRETLDDVNADHKALSKATSIRMDENKGFQAAETDFIESIDAVKHAMVAMSKQNPTLAELRAVAHKLLDGRVSHNINLIGGLNKHQAEVFRSFLHSTEKSSSFLAIPGMQSYAPQGGQVFGIVQQLKEDFEANLASSQKTEARAVAQFEALKAAKEDEIATGRRLIVSIDASIAKFQEKYAQAAKELEDTEGQLADDTAFLNTLNDKCAVLEADYERRTKDRITEISAVDDTLVILNSDESFSAFDKMLAPSFLQTGVASSRQNRRQRVVAVLKRTAVAESPLVAMLAAKAQLVEFTKVKESIDKMVEELNVQQKDEIAERDACIDALNANKRSAEGANDQKDALQTKIADLEHAIATLTADIEVAQSANAQMAKEMKSAEETREEDRADYQSTVQDHRVMCEILRKAISRMKQVFAFLQRHADAPHIQTSATRTDAGNGPAKFSKYQENAGGGKVVHLLEVILADVEQTLVDATNSENDAQSAYEYFLKAATSSTKTTNSKISNLSGARASAKEQLTFAKTGLSETMTELEGLSATNGDLHKSCDFLLDNFTERQQARADEIAGLNEAKSVVSGLK